MTTAAQPAPKGQRALLSFSVEGLPPREELLFKSLVRLLDHRTHQHWAWKAGEADLRVVGEQMPPPTGAPAVPVLAVGQVDPQRGAISWHCRCMPMRSSRRSTAWAPWSCTPAGWGWLPSRLGRARTTRSACCAGRLLRCSKRRTASAWPPS